MVTMPLSSFSPSGSSLPGFHLTSSSQRRAGGTSILVGSSLATSPPPILHPLNSDTPHLSPTIHQHWPFEILNLHSLHDLSVKGLLERFGDPHAVVDTLSALVMMDTVEPEHRLVFITGLEVVEVLLTSAESIPASLALVSCHLLPALITPEVVSFF